MRAAVLYSAAGSLLLTTLATAPAEGTRGGPGDAEARGTTVAAERAAAAGVGLGSCPEAEDLPGGMRCGTVAVPLDYARPDGKRIRLTVSRVRATHRDPDNSKRKVPGQGRAALQPGRSGGLRGCTSRWSAWSPSGSGSRRRATSSGTPRARRRALRAAVLPGPREFFKGPRPAPTQPSDAYKKERAAEAEAYARGCAERHGDALRHYHSSTTPVTWRSSGPRWARSGSRSWARRTAPTWGRCTPRCSPSRVRRMVFDSVVNPDPKQVWYRNNLDQSAAFEDRWTDFRSGPPSTTPCTGSAPRRARCRTATRRRARGSRRSPRAGRWAPRSCKGRS
ncbi:hypothetical protein LV779_10370 [Streptomyces thinghirensis]|nr:hypothetical protein [Streptomyces thinghirensis]